MRTEYKRDMNHNYLILHGEGEVDTGSYQVRMLVGNVMPSILKCRVQELDGQFSIYYDITSRHSLASVYEEKKFLTEDLKLIFGSFIQAMEEMEEYLLNPEQLLLAPDYMYLDVEKRQMYFCCLPGQEGDVHRQFLNLTEYVLPKIDHTDRRAVALGYGIYRKALEDSFHLEHIKEELYKTREEDSLYEGTSKEAHPPMDGPWQNENTEPDLAAAEDAYANILMNENNFQREERKRRNRKGKEWNSGKTKDRTKERIKEQTKNQTKNQTVEQTKEKKGLWKRVLVCGINGGIFLGIAAAKVYGFLPGVSMEMILGGMITALGVGMLAYVIGKKLHEMQKEKALVRSREEKTPIRSWEDIDGDKGASMDRGRYSKTVPAGMYSEGDRGAEKTAGDVWTDLLRESEEMVPEQSAHEKTAHGKTAHEIIAQGKMAHEKRTYGNTSGNYKEKTYGETVVLSAGCVQGPATLVSREPGELATIYLQEEITVIGKMETAADAVIDLPTVSRMHAKIRRRDGEYYLSDLNSRNGTAVNGRLLQGGEDYCLQEQDEVDFAQARYVFLK